MFDRTYTVYGLTVITLNSSQSSIRSCKGGEPPTEVMPTTQVSTVVVGGSGVVVALKVVSSAVVEFSVAVSRVVSSAGSVVVPSDDVSEDKTVEVLSAIVVDSTGSDEDTSEVDVTDSEAESSTLRDVVEATSSSVLDSVSESVTSTSRDVVEAMSSVLDSVP